jgi:hypothetical protein
MYKQHNQPTMVIPAQAGILLLLVNQRLKLEKQLDFWHTPRNDQLSLS